MEKLPFIPNHIYNRRADIHAHYGGNWQNGISVSAKIPYIFIFSGKSGKQHGYKDNWDNPDVFSYTGEGQIGDMKFTNGNRALRDHVNTGKRVFLFESLGKGLVQFIAELEVIDYGPVNTLDTKGIMREGIVFFFKRKGVYLPAQAQKLVSEPKWMDTIEWQKADIPNETERKGLVISRVGQGVYRKKIIHRWEYQCAVTGFNNLDVLIASHILPWASSTNQERLDVNNGILLSPTYDALFDQHYISFENRGNIILSDAIEVAAFQKIGVKGSERISNFNSSNFPYLEQHRTQFYVRH